MKASVVPSMKKIPTELLWSFHRRAIFCERHARVRLDLVYPEKVNVTTLEECCLRLKVLREGDYIGMPSLCHAHRGCLWVVPRNQSVAAKPLDQVLIRKIRFGKKNIRLQSKVIKFDPRSPNQRTREENSFKILSESLQNCLPASSFFLFHDIKSNCVEESDPEETNEAPKSVPFTDSYDIATERFKSMVDSLFPA